MQAGQSLLIVLWATACLASAGCAAKRELVIVSEPPGALVRLDDTVVGTTPYTTGFDAYGTRRITLYQAGYRNLSHVENIKPPWYGRFPLDVISEVLLPFGWHDRHLVTLEMVPESGRVTEPDLQEVLKRAEALRLAEPTGPRPATPGPPRATPKPVSTTLTPTPTPAPAEPR